MGNLDDGATSITSTKNNNDTATNIKTNNNDNLDDEQNEDEKSITAQASERFFSTISNIDNDNKLVLVSTIDNNINDNNVVQIIDIDNKTINNPAETNTSTLQKEQQNATISIIKKNNNSN